MSKGYAYTCPDCETQSTSNEWNDVTINELEKFGALAIMPIDLCPKDSDIEYICPGCYGQYERKDLKKGFATL